MVEFQSNYVMAYIKSKIQYDSIYTELKTTLQTQQPFWVTDLPGRRSDQSNSWQTVPDECKRALLYLVTQP